MNVLSLFAGIGGLDLGLERAGMTVVGQVEINPFCQRVLARHWPEVPRHDDVRTCVEWWLGEPRPAVDVVAGGFPCQPVSFAGQGRAQADERWLWPAAWAVIRDLRPRFAIMENVPGLLVWGMGDVLGDLAAIGYDAEWDCVPAAAVGAPHRRDRVFVVAYPASGGTTTTQQSGLPCGAEPGGEDVADAAGTRREAGARPSGGSARDDARWPRPDGLGDDVADTDGPGLEGHRGPVAGTGELAAAAGGATGRAGLADADGQPKVWAPVARRERGAWATEPDVGRVAHGVPQRVDRLRALGNAVVPQVAEHIGRLVMTAALERAA